MTAPSSAGRRVVVVAAGRQRGDERRRRRGEARRATVRAGRGVGHGVSSGGGCRRRRAGRRGATPSRTVHGGGGRDELVADAAGACPAGGPRRAAGSSRPSVATPQRRAVDGQQRHEVARRAVRARPRRRTTRDAGGAHLRDDLDAGAARAARAGARWPGGGRAGRRGRRARRCARARAAARRRAPARGRWRPWPSGGARRGAAGLGGRPARPRSTESKSPTARSTREPERLGPVDAGVGRDHQRAGRAATGSGARSSGSPPVTTTIVVGAARCHRADSLRRHYPVQVPRVGGAPSPDGHPLSPAAPSSPSCWPRAVVPRRVTVDAVQRTLFDDEHELFRESVRRLHRRRDRRPTTRSGSGRDRRPRAVHQGRARTGSSAWPCPRSYGGGGVDDFRYNVVIAEEIQRAGVNAAGLGLDAPQRHLPAVLPALCTDEQKARWLPGHLLRRADHRHRHDRAGHRLRPRVDDHHAPSLDGDHYVVNGSKTFITNGINADLVITAVKTDPTQRHAGMSPRGARAGHGRLRARPQPRQDRHARAGHRRAVLHRRARAGRQPARRRGRGLPLARHQPAAGAPVDRGHRRRRRPHTRST